MKLIMCGDVYNFIFTFSRAEGNASIAFISAPEQKALPATAQNMTPVHKRPSFPI